MSEQYFSIKNTQDEEFRINHRDNAGAIVINSDELADKNNIQTLIAPYNKGLKNYIINGNFDIWQRGTSFTNIAVVGSTSPYTADRWSIHRSNTINSAVLSVSKVNNGLRISCTTASTTVENNNLLSLKYIIEGYDAFSLNNKPFTLTFKVKTNKVGQYGVTFYNYATSSVSTPQSINVTEADTIHTFNLTFNDVSGLIANNNAGLGLYITLMAGSSREGSYYPNTITQTNLFDNTSNYFELYEVQLEEGSVATPFEHRPIGLELSLCQRYYEVLNVSEQPQANVFYSNWRYLPAVSFALKRVIPTISILSISVYPNSNTDTTNYNFLMTNRTVVLVDMSVRGTLYSYNLAINAEL